MKKIIYSLLPLFIVILSGCSKKDKELDFIKVTSGLTYTVEAAGGTVNINVETNTDYFVSIPDDAKDWISVVESRASRHETISLSVSENGIDARSTIVYINNKNGEQLAKIQISQKGEDPCFNVKNGSTVEVESKGGTVDLKFETNIEYSVSIPEEAKSWISVVESRAIRQETVTLSISENGIDARSAIVYLNNKNGEQLAKIKISQKGEDPCFNVKNGSTVEVESKGGSVDLKFETNIEYSVSIPEEAQNWISVVESRAIRQETVTLSISENGIDARSAFIYLIDKKGEQLAKVQISQKGEDPCFNVKNGSTVEVESKGGTVDLKFETNLEYSVSIPEEAQSWISVVESRAIRQETVTLSISENKGEARTATIQFLDKGQNTLASIKINQAKRSSDTSINIPSDMTEAFPDENFRKYVLERFDTDMDNVISEYEALIVRQIWISNSSIKNLEGIQYFKNLDDLRCENNQLTTLDVSKNTKLIFLYCGSNQLTTLDVSKNTALTKLNCYENQLTSLDVSKNTRLTELDFSYNKLTTLDVSKNTALKELNCDHNQLTSLDASKNTRLTELWCYSNQLTSLDVSECTALELLRCEGNKLTTLDVSKNTALTKLECYNNQLTSLDVSGCTGLKSLNCDHNQLTSLDVSACTELKSLICHENLLTSLDVSKNLSLTSLFCYNNRLTTLDVSKNTALTYLYCWDNQLTSLDVSKNTALTHLSCENNQLTTLDVSKNTALSNLDCRMSTLETLYLKSGKSFYSLDVSLNTKKIYID